MKQFKIFLWIFILMIIETVFSNYIRIMGAVPDVVFAFAMAFVMLEDEFSYAVSIGIICGVLVGALGTGSFAFSVLLYTYSSLIVFNLRNKPRYMNDFFKVILWTFVLKFTGEGILYLIINFSMNISALVRIMIPSAVYTMAASAAVYFILKKTMFKTQKQKKLLI